jgi:hypothetical protein
MEMLNLIANLLHWLAAPSDVDANPRDPLMHPALREMSQRELADLPFQNGVRRSSSRGSCAA